MKMIAYIVLVLAAANVAFQYGVLRGKEQMECPECTYQFDCPGTSTNTGAYQSGPCEISFSVRGEHVATVELFPCQVEDSLPYESVWIEENDIFNPLNERFKK